MVDAIKKMDGSMFPLITAKPVESKEEIKTKEAATQFESMFLHQMLSAMSATTGKDELLGGSREQEFAKDMYNQALAESIAKGRGIGIKDVMLRQNPSNTKKLEGDM